MQNTKQLMPLVSICIPIYNGDKYLKEALLSAVNQTYSNIEIIISDDNSKDNSLSIAKELLAESTIKFEIINHHPNGIGANWNNSIKKANGKYIKLLFQDDVLDIDCVEKMVFLAEQETNVGMVFCKRKFIYDNTEVNRNWLEKYKILHNSWGFSINEKIYPGTKFLKSLFLYEQPLNKIGEPTATLILKECFDKVGYFNELLTQALDLEYYFRIMTKYSVGFVDEELIFFRLHEDQQTSKNQNRKINDFEKLPLILLKKLNFNLSPKVFFQLINLVLAQKIFKVIKK
jgi:glycosyltransferase involved in cell wall biosynthesis